MQPLTRLKLGSVVFAVFWIAFMILWSGEFEPANMIILTVCGGICGTFWYLGMRWFFRRARLLSGNDPAIDPLDRR